jgi:hypothetical protein
VLVKIAKIAAVVVGGPVFAFIVLWLGCSSSPPAFGEYCGPHLMLGLLAGLAFAFWFCVPMCAAIIRVIRGKE